MTRTYDHPETTLHDAVLHAIAAVLQDERLDADQMERVSRMYHEKGLDPETPVPVWNEAAQAWEV